MEITKQEKILPLFRKETLLDSRLAYKNFRKKGYRIMQKLTIQFKDIDRTNYRNQKTLKKAKLLRVFQKIKSIKKVDLKNLVICDTIFYHPALLYIAKRISTISCLSTRDLREYDAQYKESLTSWPKHMKHLKSFHYDAVVTHKQKNLFRNEGETNKNEEKTKEIKLATDYLRYLPRLEDFEIIFPWSFFDEPTGELDKVWRFEKYPSSIKRLCFHHSIYEGRTIRKSADHLTNLKFLKLWFQRKFSQEAIDAVLNFLPQVNQLECLHICFPSEYNINASAQIAFKALTKLKKVKMLLVMEKNNELNILESLEECPLEDLNLRVNVKSDPDILLIKDFLRKKQDLKVLKLRIMKSEVFESLKETEDLFKTIDNLPQLTSLSVHVKTFKHQLHKKEIYPEIDLSFGKLLSRGIPLKKFRISLNQHTLSQNGFTKLLENLKGSCPHLEKLRVDVGVYKPKGASETDAIITFINSMKSVRSLQFLSVDVPLRPFFLELIEAIYKLKLLKSFSLGEVSGKVTKPSYMDGVEKILSKNGLEKFTCGTSEDFKRTLLKKAVNCPRLEISKIKRKNPYLKKCPSDPIFATDNEENLW